MRQPCGKTSPKLHKCMLYDFVSDAYDELVEEDKVKWKERVEAIDALVGNTNVYFCLRYWCLKIRSCLPASRSFSQKK